MERREWKGIEIVVREGVFETLGRVFTSVIQAMAWIDKVEGDM